MLSHLATQTRPPRRSYQPCFVLENLRGLFILYHPSKPEKTMLHDQVVSLNNYLKKDGSFPGRLLLCSRSGLWVVGLNFSTVGLTQVFMEWSFINHIHNLRGYYRGQAMWERSILHLLAVPHADENHLQRQAEAFLSFLIHTSPQRKSFIILELKILAVSCQSKRQIIHQHFSSVSMNLSDVLSISVWLIKQSLCFTIKWRRRFSSVVMKTITVSLHLLWGNTEREMW